MTVGRPSDGARVEGALGVGAPTTFPTLAESRRALLEEIGASPEMTFVKPIGNIGDELIWAGTRRLLEGHIYREIDIEELPCAGGELAVIAGGGAWSRRYNEVMPEVLAIAEERFSRVVVFPSTFETIEDRVRTALMNSNATFFARELESHRQISGICRAGLAHDGAYFFDFSKYSDVRGSGELNAFRIDDERLEQVELPRDNDDISLSAGSLDAWLMTIAKHAAINTDRAHVMIAAALMGRRVNFASSSYFKLDALAESALGDYDVRRIPAATNGRVKGDSPVPTTTKLESERIAVAVVGRDKPTSIGPLVASIAENATPVDVLLNDRNSRPQTREAILRMTNQHPSVQIRLADRDVGLADSMRLVAQEARSEYLIFMDYELRLSPGALDEMVKLLDANPTTQAVAPTVLAPDGSVRSCGGSLRADTQTVSLTLTANGLQHDQLPNLPSVTDWVPLRGALIRRTFLQSLPLAAIDDVHVQNIDWCLRANEADRNGFMTCPAAVIHDEQVPELPTQPTFVSRSDAVSSLPAQAEFFQRHGKILADRLKLLVPDLQRESGDVDAAAAALFLACVEARGPSWTLMEWMNGGLEPLFAGVDSGTPGGRALRRDRSDWLEQRNEMLIGIENGTWWKLRGRLEPLRRAARFSRATTRGGPTK